MYAREFHRKLGTDGLARPASRICTTRRPKKDGGRVEDPEGAALMKEVSPSHSKQMCWVARGRDWGRVRLSWKGKV